MEIERNYYLNKLIAKKENKLIKIITGIRRCGKSYLLEYIFKNYLINSGVKEDHGDKYSFEYLENEGFNKEIIDALKLLTHNKEIPYMDYIANIAKNNVAKVVKIEDLKHNLDIRRTSGEKAKKYDIYVKALEFLEKGE